MASNESGKETSTSLCVPISLEALCVSKKDDEKWFQGPSTKFDALEVQPFFSMKRNDFTLKDFFHKFIVVEVLSGDNFVS